jgi:hypothetical protein
MACGARGRVSRNNVRRRASFLEVLRVARIAIRRCAFVLPAGMASLAIESGVRPGERKVSELLMRKCRPQPGVLRVAGVTRGREIQSHMIGVRRAVELRRMACRAIRQDAILPSDKGLVAGFTFHGGVSAKERKEILVVPNLLLGSEPALHDVALGAVRAKFAQMNVGMAIGTVLAHIGEVGLRMTLSAGHSYMPATERISGVIVIEFRNAADRSPTIGGMAILARNRQWTMRAGSRVPLRRGRRSTSWVAHKKYRAHYLEDY